MLFPILLFGIALLSIFIAHRTQIAEIVLFGFLLALVISSFVNLFGILNLPLQTIEYNRYEIVSFEFSDSVSGSFTLGAGQIGQNPVYFVNKVINENTTVNVTINANEATFIIEEESLENTGYVVVYQTSRVNNKWLVDIASPVYLYEIHVPVGTVRRVFSTQ